MGNAPTVLAAQTINSRISEVALELGNRDDITSGNPPRVALWLRNAYINLCMEYDFEGLEITQNLQISNSNTYLWPQQGRAIKSLCIQSPDGSVTYPDFKDIQTVRRMQQTTSPGLAAVYTLYANQLIFAPPFDGQSYTLILDLWQRPLITPDVISTPLLLPDDWYEALDYLAMMRGHALLGEVDKALALQRLLYGYTDPSTAQHTPGLLYNLQLRRQANAPARDYGLQPRSNKIKYTT